MMRRESTGRSLEDALAEQRAFVHAFGGFSLETAGGTLVANERLPVPGFNFVQDVQVARGRQSSFFERALDFYFQRAIRPTFRVRSPAAAHVDATLNALGFRARPEPFEVLRGGRSPQVRARGGPIIERASREEIPTVAAFFTYERERDEFRRCLEVLTEAPNPGEELVALLAKEGDRAVGATLLYRQHRTVGLHLVATAESARGRGIASAIVEGAVDRHRPSGVDAVTISSGSKRLTRRLEGLGFEVLGSFVEYELPRDAALVIPPVGPPGPPRWRPPRASAATP